MIVMTSSEKWSDKKAVEEYYLLVEDEAHVLLIVPPEGSKSPFYYAIGDEADTVIDDKAIRYFIKQVEDSRDSNEWNKHCLLYTSDFSKYANDLYELRKNKGMTLDQAKELLKTNSRYFATMMVKEGDADGFVSGASHPTSDTLRPALQILKAAPGTKLVSAFFVMVLPDKEFGDDGVFIFADSGLNEYPDADALSEIAISSSKSFKELIGDEPKVAMLSYSTQDVYKRQS